MAPKGTERCRPTIGEQILKMDLIVGLDAYSRITIIKNRYSGNTGILRNPNEIVDILTLILAKNLFNDKMKIFQEGLRISIKEAIEKIINEGRYDE